jgi:hypothetical protein
VTPSRRGRIANWLLGLYVIACILALTWPGYALLGNRIEPTVLGLPFSLVWVVAWVLLSFLALAAYHAWAERG